MFSNRLENCHYHQIWNCRLEPLTVWNSVKFVVWERVRYRMLMDWSPACQCLYKYDYSHCNTVGSPLTTDFCFYNQIQVWWYRKAASCFERILCGVVVKKKIQKSMDRCTGRRKIIEIVSKMAGNTIQLIDIQYNLYSETTQGKWLKWSFRAGGL